MPLPSYLHTQLCLPIKPILNRFPQRYYQESPPNCNSPPSRTCSIAPPLGIASLEPPHHSILPHSHPKGNWSFNRPWCSSVNIVRASIELLVKNFFFRFLPQIKYIAIPIVSHPSLPPFPQKQGQKRHELFCQKLISSISTLLSTSQVTTSKIHWSPHEIILISCSSFKLYSPKISTLHQHVITNSTHSHTPLYF